MVQIELRHSPARNLLPTLHHLKQLRRPCQVRIGGLPTIWRPTFAYKPPLAPLRTTKQVSLFFVLQPEGVARAGQRSSDGLMSVASPPQSRSSSAQDSYSTSATQYDEVADAPSQTASKRVSKADGKGNVVVSVRVRPDAGGNDHKPEGEWMVDGRKSLIGYRGKEGGDYFYGECTKLSPAARCRAVLIPTR